MKNIFFSNFPSWYVNVCVCICMHAYSYRLTNNGIYGRLWMRERVNMNDKKMKFSTHDMWRYGKWEHMFDKTRKSLTSCEKMQISEKETRYCTMDSYNIIFTFLSWMVLNYERFILLMNMVKWNGIAPFEEDEKKIFIMVKFVGTSICAKKAYFVIIIIYFCSAYVYIFKYGQQMWQMWSQLASFFLFLLRLSTQKRVFKEIPLL